jgi:glycogen synthase
MSKDPKVLHVVKWYPHGSDPQNGIFVQKHIEATSDAPLVLGFVNSNDKLEERDGIQIYGARLMSQVAKFGAFTARIASDLPEIIHFHCYAPDLLPLLWYARRKGIKTIHTEHGSAFLPDRLSLLQGWRRKAVMWYFQRLHGLTCISPALRDGLSEISGNANINIVPNIISTAVKERTYVPSSFSFCVVADVVFETKAQEIILECFQQLPQAKAELHFYGGGPDLERLQGLARTLPNVWVHGRKTNEEILNLLPNHDALILHSHYETFGITVFEARTAGLWAISKSSFGGAPWYDDGVLIADTQETLNDQMKSLIRAEKATLGKFDALSSESIGTEFHHLYREILG